MEFSGQGPGRLYDLDVLQVVIICSQEDEPLSLSHVSLSAGQQQH